MKADHGSYVVTTYMTSKLTWRYKNKRKEERKRKEDNTKIRNMYRTIYEIYLKLMKKWYL